MRLRSLVCHLARLSLLAFIASSSYISTSWINTSYGQLYTEDFDDGNASSRWTANGGIGFDDPIAGIESMDTNFDRSPLIGGVDGVNDDFSGFAFDYSVHGVPPAPNSSDPNSTIGLQLQANLFSNRLGGFSASPNSLNLTGDYSITFDYWGSTIGPFPFGGSSSTMLSTFGLLTAGTTSQSILSADGVFFGAVADGGSGADYRVYSQARTFSHQIPDPLEPDPIDLQATYHAGGRNGPEQLYLDAVGDPSGSLLPVTQSVIDAVELLYPSGDPENPTMGGPLFSGAAGFQWHEMEIKKAGPIIDWFMNGFKLITMDITEWDDPDNTIVPGGGNISFGHSDTNFSSPATQEAIDLVYTLIDNIEVNPATAPPDDADFDDNNFVDGNDFIIWQSNVGTPDALNGDGDANGDMMVDGSDLLIWKSQYDGAPPLAGLTAVPEPATLLSLITFFLFSLLGYRPCRQIARR